MKKALEHTVSVLSPSSPAPLLVGVEGLYDLPPTYCRAPTGERQSDVVVVGRADPSTGLEYNRLIREADNRLRVGGYMVLSAGFQYFDQNTVAKRYQNTDPDRLRIRKKISAAEIPWLQRGTQTSDEHYTYLFDECMRLFGDDVANVRVLSFGCSTGQEVRAFKSRGFGVVHGVEINPVAIAEARAADPKGVYVEELNDLEPGPSYDLIFSMAVLCSFPSRDPVGEFPFSKFVDALIKLDSKLLPGGFLVLGSVQYDFRETEIACRYRPIFLENPLLRWYASGRIPKWSPTGMIRPLEATLKEGAVPIVYQKLSETSDVIRRTSMQMHLQLENDVCAQ